MAIVTTNSTALMGSRRLLLPCKAVTMTMTMIFVVVMYGSVHVSEVAAYLQSNHQRQGKAASPQTSISILSRGRRQQQQQQQEQRRQCPVVLSAQQYSRENEIRRKIAKLKREGKIDGGGSGDTVSYESKVRKKLGNRKAKLLGMNTGDGDDDDDETKNAARSGSIGSLSEEAMAQFAKEEQDASYYGKVLSESSSSEINVLDPSLYGKKERDDEDDADLEEEEFLEMVALKLKEKRQREREEKEARMKQLRQQREEQAEQQQQQQQQQGVGGNKQLTSGIGGSWSKNATAKVETYKPSKSGTWGVFDRPKDISKAYGGGRRIGPGYSNEQAEGIDTTKLRLQRYRERVGIDVESEKIHKDEIEEAKRIAAYAMERGMYATAVSALEKVTRYCSSNSPVGGAIFLDLAMAYEAVGRTKEAVTVYTTLSKCRIEKIKYNAKRLLYGIEAMDFMRNDVRSEAFSKKKIKSTFIDTTGLNNIADNFDDKYATAYIDLDRGFYKKLSESVVRSNREARQILLKATGAGEVERVKIIQALRSVSRRFDDELEKDIEFKQQRREEKEMKENAVAMIDGVPILPASTSSSRGRGGGSSYDEFSLCSSKQMIENINGEWQLQLLADKKGDGVKYYNTSLSWQRLDVEPEQLQPKQKRYDNDENNDNDDGDDNDDDDYDEPFLSSVGSFRSVGVTGFLSVEQKGDFDFDRDYRILRQNVASGGGGGGDFLSGLLGGTKSGAPRAVNIPHQVMAVDSVLLITRVASSTVLRNSGIGSGAKSDSDSEKEYFAVWRKVPPGTYSSSSSSSPRP